ncbi:hypothetical protein CYMTET_7038 [Cymbomonas tetramitiformis]|uniref:DDE Tnp4 domain-containing protein n=1 Tax=Cymbomonas tetramitiformis TaxID=36881 RepID=A0AAE0GWE0_9CHLO|nr:hypothetical protein CYMTET_7038 [Cymbomonas tetramitiformis]
MSMKEIARRTGGAHAIDSSDRAQIESQTIESQMNRIVRRKRKTEQRETDPEGSKETDRRSKAKQREADPEGSKETDRRSKAKQREADPEGSKETDRPSKAKQREADPEGSKKASRETMALSRQRRAKRSRSAPPIMAREEALLFFLARFAFPGRWVTHMFVFGGSPGFLSESMYFILNHIYDTFSNALLDNLDRYAPLFESWAAIIRAKGGTLLNCAVFIDGTIRGMCKPARAFNTAMNGPRTSVEWGFGKVMTYLGCLDMKSQQKLLLIMPLGKFYHVACIIANCHTCCEGSVTGRYFNSQPPTLEAYLDI